ncbi:MAG: energy-coupling factor transporter transmembrane component T [Kyrpidia sp.]|nr:energy-coupling factor transporter transmembrane component T [Kyrpidia sp.]
MRGEPLIGQFLPGGSCLHRLDPRSKILATFLLTIDVLKAQWPWEVLAMGILAGIGTRVGRVGLLQAVMPLRPLLFLILFSAAMNLTTPGPVWIRVGPVGLSRPGVLLALDTVTRLPILILTASLLVWTTSPAALADGLAAATRPLGKLGRVGRSVQALLQDMVFFAGLALRLIPLVHHSFRRVRQSFLARGLEVDTGPVKVRWRYLADMTVPWLVDILRRADDISLALTAREYRRRAGYTLLHVRPWRAGETLLAIGSVIVTLWVWRGLLGHGLAVLASRASP